MFVDGLVFWDVFEFVVGIIVVGVLFLDVVGLIFGIGFEFGDFLYVLFFCLNSWFDNSENWFLDFCGVKLFFVLFVVVLFGFIGFLDFLWLLFFCVFGFIWDVVWYFIGFVFGVVEWREFLWLVREVWLFKKFLFVCFLLIVGLFGFYGKKIIGNICFFLCYKILKLNYILIFVDVILEVKYFCDSYRVLVLFN